MVKRKKSGITAERYVETALELIAEQGGSTQVNLREISRRMGCAHTNAYNYFESRQDLLWHAFRQALKQFGQAIGVGLNDTLSGQAYFRQLFHNMITWAVDHPGLHRFISSDPIDPAQLPRDIIETVITIKGWIVRVLKVLACGPLDDDAVDRLVNITLAYLDGEVFNFINGRVLPGEDVVGRVVDNLEHLFMLLTSLQNDGIVLAEQVNQAEGLNFPKLEV